MESNFLAFAGMLSFIFGIAIIILSFRMSLSSSAANVALILSLLLISVGIYLLFVALPWYVIMKKFVGFLIFAIGFFLVFLYPSESDYQSEEFTIIGVLIGLIFLGIGLYMLFF